MERFKLFNSNGVYYIEKSGMKLALSYKNPVSIFSDDYYPIQINNKPIIKPSGGGFDIFLNGMKDMAAKMDLHLPSNIGDMVKDLLKDPAKLREMSKNMGVDLPPLGDDFDFDAGSDLAVKEILREYSQRAGIKLNGILASDNLNKFIVLIEFNKESITFFTQREEVGEIIGTSYHITNIKSSSVYEEISVLEIEGVKLKSIFGFNGKYVYLNKDRFNQIINLCKIVPESKIDTDYIQMSGMVNDTYFLFDIKGEYLDKKAWVGKFPELNYGVELGKLIKNGKINMESYIPLSFFENGVLIDGINRKFGYKKSI